MEENMGEYEIPCVPEQSVEMGDIGEIQIYIHTHTHNEFQMHTRRFILILIRIFVQTTDATSHNRTIDC